MPLVARPRHLVLLVSVLLSAGCTTLDPAASGASPEPAPPVVDQAEVEQGAATEGSASGLEAEVLYNLLVAELAGQLRQLDVASVHYLRAARATGDPAVAGRATAVALFAGKEERARGAAEIWVEAAPADTRARQTLAALHIRAGERDAAVAQIEALLEHGADDPDFDAIGRLLQSREHREQAMAVMGELVERYPDNATIRFARARLAHRLGAHDQALEAVEQVLEQRPDWTAALLLRATTQRARAGEPEAALPDLEAAVGDFPGDRSLRLAYARYLVDSGEVERAREQFNRLAEDEPDDPEVRFALGLLALEQADWAKAEDHFGQLTDAKRAGEAAYYLGMALEEQGKDEQALRAYQRVGGGQHATDARIRAAWLMAEGGDLVAARHYLQAAEVNERGDAIRVKLAEGRLLARHGHHEAAIKVYDDALGRFSEQPELLYGRAMAAAELGRVERVEADLRRLLQQRPDHAHALNALGYTLTDQTDRHEEAREYIRRALELDPEDPNILDSMGWVEYHLGNFDEAEKWLRRAWEAAPGPEIAAHLGEVLWESGQRRAARRIWDEGLAAEPDAEILRETMHRYLE